MKEFSRGKFGLLFSVPSFQLIFYLAYGEQASMQQFPAKESGSWTSNYLVYVTPGMNAGAIDFQSRWDYYPLSPDRANNRLRKNSG